MGAIPRQYTQVKPGVITYQEAQELNRALADLHRLLSQSVSGDLKSFDAAGGIAFDVDPPTTVQVKLTAIEDGQYSWHEVVPITAGSWEEKIGGIHGSAEQIKTGVGAGTQITGLASTTGLYPGQTITGTSVTAGCVIESVDNTTTLTVTEDVTGATTFTFRSMGPAYERNGYEVGVPRYAEIYREYLNNNSSLEWCFDARDPEDCLTFGEEDGIELCEQPANPTPDCLDFADSGVMDSCEPPITAVSLSMLECLNFGETELVDSCDNVPAASSGIVVRKNSSSDVGTRPRLNLIEGSNITLTVADDAVSNEVDITIAAAGSGSGGVSTSTALVTGTTTDAWVNILDVSAAGGIHGTLGIKNTGTLSALTWKVTAENHWGSSAELTNTFALALEIKSITLDNTAYTLPWPFTRITVAVQTNNPGNHTTFTFKPSLMLL